MNILEALTRTTTGRLLARPIGMARGGYYVEAGQVWDHNPLRLSADLVTPLPMLARTPDWKQLAGEWETVERP